MGPGRGEPLPGRGVLKGGNTHPLRHHSSFPRRVLCGPEHKPWGSREPPSGPRLDIPLTILTLSPTPPGFLAGPVNLAPDDPFDYFAILVPDISMKT